MLKIIKKNEREWGREELHNFMLPLKKTFYEEEYASVRKAVERKVEEQLILVIDEDPILLRDIRKFANRGYVVITISNLKHAFAAFYVLEPDCVILGKEDHLRLGAFRLIDELEQRSTPIIMLGHSSTKEIRKSSYSLGVDDFVPRSVDLDELFTRIKRQLERKKVLDQFIYFDELTKVYNRKYLATIYGRYVEKLKNEQKIFSMALVDLDNFKEINDTYGHLTGDEVLIALAHELKKGVRNNGEVFRFGGEEFLLLFPDTSQARAEKKMVNILKSFSDIRFFQNKQTFTCTFSSGVHKVATEDTNLKSNLEQVDRALLQAKNNGKNQVLAL